MVRRGGVVRREVWGGEEGRCGVVRRGSVGW